MGYKPVSCGRHSEFELAIMHGEKLDLSWQDPQAGLQHMQVIPKDLIVENHEEFLLVSNDDHCALLKIRLDWIV